MHVYVLKIGGVITLKTLTGGEKRGKKRGEKRGEKTTWSLRLKAISLLLKPYEGY
jgi:hypothetical protein